MESSDLSGYVAKDISVPPGNLNIMVEIVSNDSLHYETIVTKIFPNSVLFNKIEQGDIIFSIDDEIVKGKKIADIEKIMSKKMKLNKKFIILRNIGCYISREVLAPPGNLNIMMELTSSKRCKQEVVVTKVFPNSKLIDRIKEGDILGELIIRNLPISKDH